METINVIMASIKTKSTNLRWNSARAYFYSPKKGLRQGDPISPTIVTSLSHLICDVVNKGDWLARKAGRNGPMIYRI